MVERFRTADDVEKDRAERKKEEFKKRLGNDINDVLGEIFPQREREKIQKEVKKIKRKFSILKWMGILLLFLFLATMIFGMIWLLKFFITGLF